MIGDEGKREIVVELRRVLDALRLLWSPGGIFS
jgi:hypothetical protein